MKYLIILSTRSIDNTTLYIYFHFRYYLLTFNRTLYIFRVSGFNYIFSFNKFKLCKYLLIYIQ